MSVQPANEEKALAFSKGFSLSLESLDVQFSSSYWEKCCHALLIPSSLRSTEASQSGVNRMAFKLIEKYSQSAWYFCHRAKSKIAYKQDSVVFMHGVF